MSSCIWLNFFMCALNTVLLVAVQATLELPSPLPITLQPAEDHRPAQPLKAACSQPLAYAASPDSPCQLPAREAGPALSQDADSPGHLSLEGQEAQPTIVPAQPLPPFPKRDVAGTNPAGPEEASNGASSPIGVSTGGCMPMHPASQQEWCLHDEPDLAAGARVPATSDLPAVSPSPAPVAAGGQALPDLDLHMADSRLVQPQPSDDMAPAEQAAVRALADELLQELQGGTGVAMEDEAGPEAAFTGAVSDGEAAAKGAAGSTNARQADAELGAQQAPNAGTADEPPMTHAELSTSAPNQAQPGGRAAAPSPRASPRGSPMSSPRSGGFPSPGSSPRGATSAGRSPSLIRPLSPLGRIFALATPPLPGRPASAGSSYELDSPLEEAVDELISSICGTPFQELPEYLPTPAGVLPRAEPPHMAVQGKEALEPACAGVGTEQASGHTAVEAVAFARTGATGTTLALPAEQPDVIIACRAGGRVPGLQVPERNDENAAPDQASPAGSERSARSSMSSPLPTPKGGKAALAPDLAASPGPLRSPLSCRPLGAWQLPAPGAGTAERPLGQPHAPVLGMGAARKDAADSSPADAAKGLHQTVSSADQLKPAVSVGDDMQLLADAEVTHEASSPCSFARDSAGTPQGTAGRLGAAAAAITALHTPDLAPAQGAASAESLMSPASALAAGGGLAGGATPLAWSRGFLAGTPANSPMTAEVQPRPTPQPALLEGPDPELPTPPSVAPFPVLCCPQGCLTLLELSASIVLRRYQGQGRWHASSEGPGHASCLWDEVTVGLKVQYRDRTGLWAGGVGGEVDAADSAARRRPRALPEQRQLCVQPRHPGRRAARPWCEALPLFMHVATQLPLTYERYSRQQPAACVSLPVVGQWL